MNIIAILRVVSLLFAVAFITGCGKKEEAGASTQVAARVNAEEIAVQQISCVLARPPNVMPRNARKARREILDRLIDRQLARRHAMSEGTISLMDSGDRLTAFHVVAAQMMPVVEETAAPRIRQFLINQHSSELIAVEMTMIKEKANIV